METIEHDGARERRREWAGERWRRVARWLLPSPGTLILIGVLLWAQSVGALPGAPAAAPASGSTSTVNYQGRLADSSGTPIDGVVTFQFALYDSPTDGELLWGPEVHADVPVSAGLFSVALGLPSGGIPQDILGGDLWLEVTVAGETLSPRERLGAVPYAMQALSVPDGAISAAKLAAGAVSRMLVLRHDDATSSLADRIVVTGWGSIPGNGDVGLEEFVDPGLTFEQLPIVLVSYLGAFESGTPPGSIGAFQGVDVSAVGAWTAVPTEITKSGFTVQISRSGGTFDPDWFYGYAWVAIGTPP
jgi:hypothetical protein